MQVNVIWEATETSLLFLQDKHPHPGQPYAGLRLCAYLPDSRDGRRVLKLLDKAFNTELLFSVVTNNEGQDVVTTASIPLKTQAEGGIKVWVKCATTVFTSWFIQRTIVIHSV